ncbi:hypothetical protein [Falsigemmobacter faecalis]|uniref:Uncharacterized protein n=1 Tax=Falsigemmobacter faecalis TaxID=2488730 RepID=A0A3P3DEE8_9RHOB|nr:hypothetical protein [Falsigemmobacter faecalis]RRH72026.1 hypothetical protein EG244_16055 [Falsigemmobacter faecalis]
MTDRIKSSLLDCIQAYARAHGSLPEGGDMDAICETVAATHSTSSSEVRKVYDRDLRVWDAV